MALHTCAATRMSTCGTSMHILAILLASTKGYWDELLTVNGTELAGQACRYSRLYADG